MVDARALYVSGIGRYLREVLARLIPDERFGRITLLGDVHELHRFAEGIEGKARLEYQGYPPGFYSPRSQLEWAFKTRRTAMGGAVAFFPHFDAPVVGMPARSVVTVQDLIHFMVPEAFPRLRRHVAGGVLRRVTATAARIIVSSESTERDLVARLPATARKIEVIPFGVDGDRFRALDAPGGDAERIAAMSPFVLCVGNRKPHKNLVAAVEALSRLPDRFARVRLVVAGAAFREPDGLAERAAALGVADRVVDMGKVSDDVLTMLYRHSEALLFPSLYEGFGLPLLEAMAAGKPVIASNRSSIPEIVGDAGLLVDPHAYEEMSGALARVLSEPSLRDTLVQRGSRRVAGFTWERAAGRVVNVIHETAVAPVQGWSG